MPDLERILNNTFSDTGDFFEDTVTMPTEQELEDQAVNAQPLSVVQAASASDAAPANIPTVSAPVASSLPAADTSELRENWAYFQPTESFQPAPPVDWLKEEYPALAGVVDKYRQQGVSDDRLVELFNDKALTMLFDEKLTPAQLDERLGRTAESRKRADAALLNRQIGTIASLKGMSEQDVAKRVYDARIVGLDPWMFLTDEALYQKLGGYTRYYENVVDAFLSSAANRVADAQTAKASMPYIAKVAAGQASKEDRDQYIAWLKSQQDAQIRRQNERASNPLQWIAQAAGSMYAQAGLGMKRGAQWVPAYGAASGAAALAAGTLATVGTGGLAGLVMAGLAAGVPLAMTHGMFEETLNLETTSSFNTLLEQGLDEKLASRLAIAGGAVKAAIELDMFARMGQYIPMFQIKSPFRLPGRLHDKLLSLIWKNGPAPLLKVPTVGGAVLHGALDFAGVAAAEIGEEGLQEAVDVVTEAAGQWLADKKDLIGALDQVFSVSSAERVADTMWQAAKEFVPGMLPGALVRTGMAGMGARALRNTPEMKLRANINARVEAMQKGEQTADQKAAEVVFIPQEILQTFNQSALEKEEAKPLTVNQKLGIEEAPARRSIEEQLGITPEDIVESTGEVMISREKYETLAREDPAFAEATKDVVREGAFRATNAERARMMEQIRDNAADPLNADNEFAASARAVRDEVKESLVAAGRSEEEADYGSYIYAKHLLRRSLELGTDELGIPRQGGQLPAELHQLQVQRAAEQSNAAQTAAQNIAESNSGVFNQELFQPEDYDENGNVRPEVVQEIKNELAIIRSEAEKNGTYLKAPNGNDSNLPAGVWEMVRTRRFREWFGNSKVVDENGEPKIVYHGTTQAGFTQFDTAGSHKTADAGAFFSDRKQIAGTYAGGVENTLAPEYDESGNLVVDEYDETLPLDSEHYIYPVFLKMEHPYIVDAQGKNWDNVGEITITDLDYSDAIYSKADGTPFMNEDEAWDYIERELDDPEHQNYQVSLSGEMTTDEIARAVYRGYYGGDYVDGVEVPYDGVIFANVVDEGPAGRGYSDESTVISVPTPEQIKSVDNRGTFDAGENIFYQNQVERRYKGKLHQDSIAWAKAVDKYLIGEMGDHDIVHVMDMPIALELAGAPVREIVADKTFFNHTISGKHSGEVKPALMKKLVRSLADPIMVFDSASHPGTSLVAMLELEDDQGAAIVVPVRLQMDPTDPNSPAKITSFYGKGDPQTGTPNNKWFIKQVVDKNGNLTGRLKYVNRKKISRWSSVGGLQLPKALAPSRLPSSISTEADLVKYRKFNGNRFYQSAAPSNTLIATHGIDVSALEKAFANFDGQLPMPSLAIGRRGQQGATHYGEITLIGDKNMIDPQQNAANDVFSTDMQTPVVPDPEYDEQGRAVVMVNDEALPYTAENVLRAMLVDEGLQSYGEDKVRIAGAKKFDTVAAMHEAEGQLATADDLMSWCAEVGYPAYTRAVYELKHQLWRADRKLGPMEVQEKAADVLADWVAGKGTLESITGISDLSKETKAAAQKYKDVLAGAKTEYFEAKPRRLVDVSEFRAAVVPASTPAELRQKLEERGIRLYEYPDGDQAARQQIAEQAAREQNVFFQSQPQQVRGSIQIGPNGEGIITLFKDADRSTFFHELGHMFFDDLITDALSGSELAHNDLETLRTYLSIEDLDLANRHTFSGEARARYTEAQERFARSWEAYLMEGVAPTPEMRGVFARLKQWLIDIYRDVSRLDVELSDDVREVFDHLLMTKDEIEAASTTVEQLAEIGTMTEARISELEDELKPLSRVMSAQWDSVGLDEANMPTWVTHELIDGMGDALAEGRPELVKAIRKLGGIKYDSVVATWGEGEAKELRARDRSLFRKDGAAFDTLVTELEHEGIHVNDAQDLYDRLMAQEPKITKGLNVAITEETLPWLFYLMDDGEVRDYAAKRLRTLNKKMQSIQKELQSLQDNKENNYKGFARHQQELRKKLLTAQSEEERQSIRSQLEKLYEKTSDYKKLQSRVPEITKEQDLIREILDTIKKPEHLENKAKKKPRYYPVSEEVRQREAAGNAKNGLAAIQKVADRSAGVNTVQAAMHDSRLGEGKAGDIDVAWGKQGTAEKKYSDGFGLAHIIAKHGEGILSRIADIIANGELEVRKSKKDGHITRASYRIGDEVVYLRHYNDARLEFFVVTAYEETAQKKTNGHSDGIQARVGQMAEKQSSLHERSSNEIVSQTPYMHNNGADAVHESIPTQEAADRAAGLLRDDELISQIEADRQAWQRAQRESRKSYYAGKKAGVEQQKTKSADLLKRQKKRAAERMERQETRQEERIGKLKEKADEVKARQKDKIAELKSRLIGRIGELRTRQKERAAQVRAKVAALKEAQRKRKAERDEINKAVKFMKKALVSKCLSWAMQQKIKERLDGYTLRRLSEKKLAEARALLDYIEPTPDAELSQYLPSVQRYVKMLETVTLNDMTLADVRVLRQDIKEMVRIGRAQFDRWQTERKHRWQKGFDALMSSLGNGKAPQTEVKTIVGPADLGKQYKGVKGKLEKGKDWTLANTLGANRFFDWLGGGKGDYKSAWTHYCVDLINEALDVELKYSQARFEAMEERMQQLGLNFDGLNELRNVDGQMYSVDQLIHIYAGLKNESSRKAILYGNMRLRFMQGGEEAVQEHAARCVAALTDAERQLGDAVIADFDTHFERINNALIEAFNQGMKQEANYTPMARLEYSAQALNNILDIDENKMIEGEAQTRGAQNASLEKGFLEERMEIDDEDQKPIKLGLISLWHDQVQVQEHTAAYGKIAGDLRSILMKQDENGVTVGRKIVDTFGRDALAYLREYTNIAVQGQNITAAAALDEWYSYLGHNMAIAYLTLNFGTVLKQVTSLPRFLITAGPKFIAQSAREFLADVWSGNRGEGFLNKVYELDPQMKNRAPDAFLQVLKDARKYGKVDSAYMKALKKLQAPISYMDRVVSAIGWWATYQSNLKHGLSKADAVREAQRAVALTQQTPLAKDMPRVWNQNGLARLMMIFTSDAANTWGMSVYDLTHKPEGKQKLATVAALALTALLMGAVTGGPDDDDNWIMWYMRELVKQQVGATPVIGKEIMAAIESMSGRGFGQSNYSALTAPFVKLMQGFGGMAADDADKMYSDGSTKRERALVASLEGLSLLAPFPFTAVNRIRRIIRSEDGGDAARILFGMRLSRRHQ